jgi:hypothetical protein
MENQVKSHHLIISKELVILEICSSDRFIFRTYAFQ